MAAGILTQDTWLKLGHTPLLELVSSSLWRSSLLVSLQDTLASIPLGQPHKHFVAMSNVAVWSLKTTGTLGLSGGSGPLTGGKELHCILLAVVFPLTP